MNLLAMMKQEVSELHLTDKLEIAYYLYMRTGQLFEYDPLWGLADSLELYKIKNKQIDIENITDRYLVCFTWSNLFKALLKSFSIEAFIKSDSSHAYVIVTISDKNYSFDLTKDYEDLMLIKFGFPSKNNHEIVNGKVLEESIFGSVENHEQELHLKNAKKYFEMKKVEFHMSEEDYIYILFKWLEKNICSLCSKAGDVSGNAYVRYVLKFMLGEEYKPHYAKFYNKSTRYFFRVYSIERAGKTYFFSTQSSENGDFAFKEIKSIKEIRFYLSAYSVDKPYNLVHKVKKTVSSSRVA